nr:hypothetical protein [Bacteroidota bacterium]
MKYRIKFLFLVIVTGIISTLLHELGHCIFYWIQGIPAGMSLVMEFPLVDISARQYSIGSLGGPLVSIILFIGSWFMIRNSKKKSAKWNIFSAFLLANSFYLIFRSLLALAKNYGGEIESMMNLFGLNFYTAAIAFPVLAIAILILWIRKFNIRISLKNAGYYVLLFIAYMATILVMEEIDSNHFWGNFPSIQIEDWGIHNPHL